MEPQKCLEDVPWEKAFHFHNGSVSRNIYELSTQIKSLSQAQFEEHSNSTKDDFIQWIIEVVNDKRLASSLKKAKTKSEYEEKIEKRIAYLEKSAWVRCAWRRTSQKLDSLFGSKTSFFVIAILILACVGVFAALTLQMNMRISSLEQSTIELEENDFLIYRQLVQTVMQLKNSTAISNIESPMDIEELFYNGRIYGPSDQLTEDKISVYDNRVVISVKNASLAGFLDTGSMTPTLTEKANSIEISPATISDIFVGDIIVYESPEQDSLVVHRVVEIGDDEQGWYAITKGDNNKLVDQYKVRFDDVKRIVIGVIY